MVIKNIGWIGTGIMGSSMCMHLIKAGYLIYVYNRTKEKTNTLIKNGAKWCDTPIEVCQHSQVIFSILGFPDDVKALYLKDGGILEFVLPGSILVDMTTSEPSLAKKIYTIALEKSATTLDAPVSGGDIGAKEGRLAFMVGGDHETFKKILPLFKLMGENIALMGPAGSGQHTKMANQILIANTMIGTVESLLYAYKAGIDQEKIIDIIGKGAAASWSINNLGRRIVKKDFAPGFFVKHFVKDMGIALHEAKMMNLSLPGLALTHQFYISAIAIGYENLGTQALYKVFERMNNL